MIGSLGGLSRDSIGTVGGLTRSESTVAMTVGARWVCDNCWRGCRKSTTELRRADDVFEMETREASGWLMRPEQAILFNSLDKCRISFDRGLLSSAANVLRWSGRF